MAIEGTRAGVGPDRPARVARRRWPVLAIAVLVVVTVVVALHVLAEDRYTSRVEVVLAAPSASLALGADPSAVLLPSDEELALARAERVVDAVVVAVGTEPEVEVSAEGSVVLVEATSREPDRAAAAADAHVAAYLDHRAEVLADRFVAAAAGGSDGGGSDAAALRVLAEFVASDQAAVHDPAPVPTVPDGRALLGDLVLAVGAGALVGMVGVVAFERVDRTIRTGRDLARSAGVPVLGAIPRVPSDRPEARDPLDPEAGSAVGESVRALRIALDSVLGDAASPPVPPSSLPSDPGVGRIVAVCGAGRGVGSTTVAVDLALVAASCGRRVVLADADLAEPSAHDRFTDEPGAGLVGILRGEISLERAVHRPVGHPNLVVLAAGASDGGAPDLLAGPRAASFFSSLAAQADLVVLDLGPALESSDTLSLAPLADAVLIVAAIDDSDGGEVADAVTDLLAVGASVVGAVLNRAPHDRARQGRAGPAQSAAGAAGDPAPADGRSSEDV